MQDLEHEVGELAGLDEALEQLRVEEGDSLVNDLERPEAEVRVDARFID